MIKKRGLITFCIVLAGIVLPGASGAAEQGQVPLQLSEKDNGRGVEVLVGDRIDLVLFENGTTGYQWEITAGAQDIVKPIGEPEFKPDSRSLVGAGGKKTFRFAAVAPGESVLTLTYRRPWEKNVQPVMTFSVKIRARPFAGKAAPSGGSHSAGTSPGY